MASRFTAGSRTTALSIAITLFAMSLVSAQTQTPAAPSDAAAKPAILNATAFAKLAPRTERTTAPPAANPPTLSLLRQATTAIARQVSAAASPGPATPDRSWMARHKWAFIISAIIAGGIFGTYGLLYAIYPE